MNPADPIFRSFLEAQLLAGMSLASESDILDLAPVPPFPPQCYLARFTCRGLAGRSATSLNSVEHIVVGIRFPNDYLRRKLNPVEVITLLEPVDLWHSNVNAPFVCVGDWVPGTPLTDLLHQLYEIFSWQKKNTVHGLNPLAMEWALQHADELPLDRRPLRSRKIPETTPEVS
jgi:hypothetical protein